MPIQASMNASDIGAAAVDLSQPISVAVARKAQDAQRAEGDAMVALIQSAAAIAAEPTGAARGAVAGATGPNRGLDLYA